MNRLRKALRRFLCALRGHVYIPSYLTRSARIRGLGSVRQFRYQCNRCGELTSWMAMKDKPEFDAEHDVRWGKC